MKDFYSSPAILPPRAAGGESKNSCCLGRGGACSSRFFAAGRSHCFARSLCGIDVHSLPRGKERTKKARQRQQCLRSCEARCSRLANKQTCTFGLPKEDAFGNRFRAALQSRLGRKTSMLFLHRPPSCHHARQGEKAKILAVLVGEGLAPPVC